MENLSTSEREYLEHICNCGQTEVVGKLETVEKLRNFISDVQYFESFYPGGLDSYVKKAHELLLKSSNKENPMEGYIPTVPDTVDVEFNSAAYHEYEEQGLNELMNGGFVLVAGGLGERLGFNGIKVSLPTEILSMLSYLGFYIGRILAIQHRQPVESQHMIPFAIMTSDNNHDITCNYLENNNFFGMRKEQVFIMKQDVIPSLINVDCQLAVSADGHLIKKPHGHGDVHFCLYRDGIAQCWLDQFSVRRLFFFQDTNALAFYTMCCTAALCKQYRPHMTSTCVKRRPHEASGALCRLKHNDGHELVCNVEYNQLEDVLKIVDSRGDFADDTGHSPFPGNSNILSFDLTKYLRVLTISKGIVPEFVNPKYKPGSITHYTQPTRLESMMQDYPKLMREINMNDDDDDDDSHLIITYPRVMAWSPVKNSIEGGRELEKNTGHGESAVSGESDIHRLYRLLMTSVNDCPCCNSTNETRVSIDEGAYVVLGPEAGCTTEEIHRHLGKNVVLKKNSVLWINCRNWYLDNIVIDGTLCLQDVSGEECQKKKIELCNVIVTNKGWRYRDIDQTNSELSPVYKIRGYVVDKEEQCVLSCGETGDCIVNGETLFGSVDMIN